HKTMDPTSDANTQVRMGKLPGVTGRPAAAKSIAELSKIVGFDTVSRKAEANILLYSVGATAWGVAELGLRISLIPMQNNMANPNPASQCL
ncbi:MAG TPA: hypothetical protein VEZ90_09140, partial [Blastocatellia bacterium]|nr:hypothetical protein [Blastocatellia bacterium]